MLRLSQFTAVRFHPTTVTMSKRFIGTSSADDVRMRAPLVRVAICRASSYIVVGLRHIHTDDAEEEEKTEIRRLKRRVGSLDLGLRSVAYIGEAIQGAGIDPAGRWCEADYLNGLRQDVPVLEPMSGD